MVTRTEEDTEKDREEEEDIFVETRHVIQVRGNSVTFRTTWCFFRREMWVCLRCWCWVVWAKCFVSRLIIWLSSLSRHGKWHNIAKHMMLPLAGSTGCPKKKGDPRLMGYTGHQKWTKHKSWVSFGKFRKFPFQWTQKLPIFVKKQLRKLRSNMATPPLKYGINWGHPADSSFAHNSLNFWLQMRKAFPMQYCNNTQN